MLSAYDGYVLICFDNFIHSMQRLEHSDSLFIIINEWCGSVYLNQSYISMNSEPITLQCNQIKSLSFSSFERCQAIFLFVHRFANYFAPNELVFIQNCNNPKEIFTHNTPALETLVYIYITIHSFKFYVCIIQRPPYLSRHSQIIF